MIPNPSVAAGLIRDASNYSWSLGTCGLLQLCSPFLWLLMPLAINRDRRVLPNPWQTLLLKSVPVFLIVMAAILARKWQLVGFASLQNGFCTSFISGVQKSRIISIFWLFAEFFEYHLSTCKSKGANIFICVLAAYKRYQRWLRFLNIVHVIYWIINLYQKQRLFYP